MQIRLKQAKFMKIKFIILFVLISFINCFSQEINKTDNNIEFNDGVFLTFDDFKKNSGIAFSQIISEKEFDNPNEINDFLKNKKIYIFDNNGIKKEIKTKNIWGYCFNNKIYIHLNNQYNFIPIVGSISHFISNKEVYHNTYTDPFDQTYNYSANNNYRTSEPQEYILDFYSGIVYEFNIKNFLLLLSKDEELYKEFVDLPKRKQRQMIYIYLRRFNQKHPVGL